MTPERWREVERLYHAAHERRSPEERAVFLRDAAGGDEELRAIVESLLGPREASAFMEPPARELVPAPPVSLDTSTDLSSDIVDRLRGFLGRPWWVWCCALFTIVAAGGVYRVLLAGPAPVGWFLRPVNDPASLTTFGVIRVSWVFESAADGGVQVNDLVTVTEVQRFVNRRDLYAPHRLEVVRGGEPTAVILTAARTDLRYWTGRQGYRKLLVMGISVLYFALAGLLIFTRPRDRTVRWGAFLLAQCGFLLLLTLLGQRLAPDVSQAVRALPLPVVIVALLAMSVSIMLPGGAFAFCASFPRPLPVSNHLWWVFLVGVAVTISIDLDWLWLPVFGSPGSALPGSVIVAGFFVGLFFLVWALFLLVSSYRKLPSAGQRRRLRIVALGFGMMLFAMTVGFVLANPAAPMQEVRARFYQGMPWQVVQYWLFAAAPILTSYAILRHRVFDIHVVVRLGLRYAAARGVLLSLVPATAMVLLLDVLMHRSQSLSAILSQRGLLYLALGGAGLVLHVKRKAWMDALDRRFFRERYDAYRLLSGVADDVRRSTSLDEAASHVIARVNEALHPESVSLMIRQRGEQVYRSAAAINDTLPVIPADARVIALARVLKRPLENSQSGTGWLQQELPRAERVLLRRARVEWLFPVLLGGAGTEAFLLLGPKRSEEPYSREDRMMLQAIAASLGLVMEGPAVSSAGFAECPECGTCYDSGSVRCDADGRALAKSPHGRLLSGRYRLDRRLGRGGMGTVYEAADTLLERRVAVKVIREEWLASTDAVARFRREAKAAASFTHRNVVTVYDFGVADDDRAYLVMELLQGGTLREELRERSSIEPRRALEILRGVSSAVAKAHERQLLHRDLKPENVFLARAEDGEVAKVLDFGLVKPLGSAHTDSLTGGAPGALIGTLAYMSPEQRAGSAAAESWDVWALTVMAFEMLTGVHPLAVSSDPGVALVSGSDVVRRASSERLGAGAGAFFERALSIDVSRRPVSVRQLLEELETVL